MQYNTELSSFLISVRDNFIPDDRKEDFNKVVDEFAADNPASADDTYLCEQLLEVKKKRQQEIKDRKITDEKTKKLDVEKMLENNICSQHVFITSINKYKKANNNIGDLNNLLRHYISQERKTYANNLLHKANIGICLKN